MVGLIGVAQVLAACPHNILQSVGGWMDTLGATADYVIMLCHWAIILL